VEEKMDWSHPAFSFSKSRKGHFDSCQRYYWLNYLGYWNGWKLSADRRVRNIYFHKNLRSLPEISGVIVHEVFSRFLRNWYLNGIRSEDLDSNIQDMSLWSLNLWNEYIRNTTSKVWRNTKKTPAILELALWKEDTAFISKWAEREIGIYRNFLKWFDANLKSKDIEPITVDDKETSTFKIDTIDVYAIPDFVYKENGIYYVIDWKSGDDEGYDEFQATLYCLWLLDKYDLNPEDIRFILYNAFIDKTEIVEFSLQQYRDCLETVRQDSKTLLLLDYKPEDSFEYTKDTKKCLTCHFQDLCPLPQKLSLNVKAVT
jgi:hypothetical protein